MSDEAQRQAIASRHHAMRSLLPAERAAAIAAAGNVIGFDRFIARQRQVRIDRAAGTA